MSGLLFGAFVAGLVGSPHCVGMCGGFAGAAADNPVPYHLGRLTTYAILGGLAGFFAMSLPGPGWLAGAVATVMLVWFSARLGGLLPDHFAPRIPGLTRVGARLLGQQGVGARYLLGATTALLPCGLVWTALAVSVGTGEPGMGAVAMIVFGLGTVPLLQGFAAGFRRVAARGRGTRLALAGAVLAAGLWSIHMRIPMDAPAASADQADPPPCHH